MYRDVHPRILVVHRRRPRMLGHIGYLLVVVRRLRVRTVLRPLVAVVSRHHHLVAAPQPLCHVQRSVQSQNPHLPYINARPYKHIVRHRDNHVPQPVIVSVERHPYVRPLNLRHSPFVHRNAYVHLIRHLRRQVRASVVVVVALVERRRAEDILVRSPHVEFPVSQQLVGKRQRG